MGMGVLVVVVMGVLTVDVVQMVHGNSLLH
jgi:hypothetical protein